MQQIKAFADTQHNEIVRALSGCGCFRVAESYKSLSVSLEEWNKTCPDECKSVVKSFFMAEMNLLTYHNADESTSEKSKDRSVANMTLSVITEDSGINTIIINIAGNL